MLVSGALADVAAVLVAVIELHLSLSVVSQKSWQSGCCFVAGWVTQRWCAMLVVRVNYKQGPYPAKWSPIRPTMGFKEGELYSRSARGDGGNSLAIGCDGKGVVQVSV